MEQSKKCFTKEERELSTIKAFLNSRNFNFFTIAYLDVSWRNHFSSISKST